MTDKIESFPPVADRSARVLILGSMPSVKSLAQKEYYAHPQNQFWPFMGELFGAGRDRPYAERLRILARSGVALWDAAHRCHRELSADATMRDVEPNDVSGLLRRCPRIRAIFCNGRKSEELFRRHVVPILGDDLERLHIGYLPSTSPANASIPRDRKLAAWREVAEWAESR